MAATATAQPQQQRKPSQAQLTAAVIAALGTAMTAAAIVAALRSLFRAAGIGAAALYATAGLILNWLPPPMEGTGPATRWAVRTNDLRRAQYFVAAARRMQAAADQARSMDQPAGAAIETALAAERRYLAQHVQASGQRITAASRADGMASQYGDVLGWLAVKDARCSPGCRSASGRNFRVSRPPVVEGHPSLPGAVHGTTCRCRPVKPFRNAPVMS